MKEIKDLLLENPSVIGIILNDLGFYKVRPNPYKNEIICCNSENGSGASIHVKLDSSLLTSDFKYGVKGDFISFLIKKRNLEYKDVIKMIKNELGIESFNYTRKDNNSIFGGVYSKIKIPDKGQRLEILDESVLNPFLNKYNTKFIKDGINLNTQKKFQIGLDKDSERIAIPWRDYEGNLVGIMGRFNGECDYSERWFPIIPFPKRDLLFGYSQNYEHLQGCNVLYIGESEKFPMQLDSMDIYTGLGIGRSEISSYQAKKIISLNPKRLILCHDEGLDVSIIKKNMILLDTLCKKYGNTEVFCIYDKDNEIMIKDSKCSATDLGKESFIKIIKTMLKGVNEI